MRRLIIIIGVMVLLVLAATSCKSSREIQCQYIDRYHVQHDSTYITNIDSIRDSIYVYQTDSLKTIERWHTRYIERYKYIAKTDTLTKDSIVYKEKTTNNVVSNGGVSKLWKYCSIVLLCIIGFSGVLWVLAKKIH